MGTQILISALAASALAAPASTPSQDCFSHDVRFVARPWDISNQTINGYYVRNVIREGGVIQGLTLGPVNYTDNYTEPNSNGAVFWSNGTAGGNPRNQPQDSLTLLTEDGQPDKGQQGWHFYWRFSETVVSEAPPAYLESAYQQFGGYELATPGLYVEAGSAPKLIYAKDARFGTWYSCPVKNGLYSTWSLEWHNKYGAPESEGCISTFLVAECVHQKPVKGRPFAQRIPCVENALTADLYGHY